MKPVQSKIDPKSYLSQVFNGHMYVIGGATVQIIENTLNPFLLDFGMQYICAGINVYFSYLMDSLKLRILPEPFILQMLNGKFSEGLFSTCFQSHS